jgi:hypothetical protein
MFATAQPRARRRAKIARMSKLSPHMHTLSLALRACGGEAPLAKALGVSAQAVTEWLTGRSVLPAHLYLKARTLAGGRR